MPNEIPLEKRFHILSEITRAQHFAWREAASQLCPEIEASKFVDKMWEVTAIQTAKAYLKKIDKNAPMPRQIAEAMVKSSIAMGEEAYLETGDNDKEAFVRHKNCPWYTWHQKLGLLDEDRPGCDIWFFRTVEEINKALGTNVKIETTMSLPDGDDCCLRRFWVE